MLTIFCTHHKSRLYNFPPFMYYPSTYEDEVIIAATIIISLLATTVTVVYVHVTANLLYH